MIRSKMNLGCCDGHRWYSPTPYRWRGRMCDAVIAEHRKCQRVLKVTRLVK